jgi:hypothetical protein
MKENNIQERRCCTCKEILPISEFPYEKSEQKYRYCCKKCHRIYDKNYKKEQRTKIIKTEEGRRKITVVSLYNSCKLRAKEKNISFDLTKESIDSILSDRCPIFNTGFDFCVGKRTSNSPSVDRINSLEGYILNNVTIISHRANAIKNNGTLDDFIRIRNYIIKV